jgi:threonine synthase
VLEKLRARYSAIACHDKETLATIGRVYNQTGRIIDPHTAVAACAAQGVIRPDNPTVILSTAHPAKFPDAVTAAIGKPPAVPPRLAGLEQRVENYVVLAPQASLIKQIISSKLAA